MERSTASDCHAVVIAVPVRNEVDQLSGLLAALAAQRDAPPFTLCLFLDNCTDDSAGLVRAFTDRLPYRIATDHCDTGSYPNAGHARRQAAELAFRAAPTGILLTTDADCEPAPDWVATNVVAFGRADIVAGRIVRGVGAPSVGHDRIERYLDRLHALRRVIDPVDWEDAPSHHWTSAASLAMRADTYRALGGFEPVGSGEDAALGDAAARGGYRLRRDNEVIVRTSARRDGRAMGGFAASLAALDGDGRLPKLVHPGDEAWRFTMHAAARMLHGSDEYGALASSLALPEREVQIVAEECRNGEAFAARIVGAPAGGMRMVEFGDAERLLTTLEDVPRVRAA